jgi:hypothetical protein
LETWDKTDSSSWRLNGVCENELLVQNNKGRRLQAQTPVLVSGHILQCNYNYIYIYLILSLFMHYLFISEGIITCY